LARLSVTVSVGTPLCPYGIAYRRAYHEKQIGSLCAVHCVNNLLQGSYFDVRYTPTFRYLIRKDPPMSLRYRDIGGSEACVEL
jgi:hypothetical protein